MRIVGGLLTGLLGLAALIVTGGLTATGLSGYEAWWIFPPIGLPLVGLFFATTWALGAGRRVRPVIGSWLALAALTWSALFGVLFYVMLQEVTRSLSPFATIGFVALMPLWPPVVLAVLLSWPLLWRQGIIWAPLALLGVALIWIASWVHLLSRVWSLLQRIHGALGLLPERPLRLLEPLQPDPVARWWSLIMSPEGWLIHAFFLVPAALALIAGLTLMAARPRRG
ncbi:hypothetical protein [Thermoflexus sp.]|uniref:hypothetical protein n=1 Tax=Thermoflexus sp. TaxID=1969742 RepID=UPI00263973CC|nr:hypothetical protein [Thermoflexus sp.]MCX7689489.1 hypothetical protein [Thermoflexus sp.]